VDWGPYTAAIRRWQTVLGRPAPHPTEPGRTGRPRLAPVFVEWLMGLPPGWVTDVPGISRSAQLRALGNGVIPAQAATALTLLLGDILTDHETHSDGDADRGAGAEGNAGWGVAA
jgi:DNA (cytosine-5)-methyltransferase 1